MSDVDPSAAIKAGVRRKATPLLRPKDAAALLVIDRACGAPRVLLGRRASGHAFMPDLYVFPGGRRDAGDHRLPFAADLHPHVFEKLLAGNNRQMRAAGARALALAAIRELGEETGLFFGGAATGATAAGSAMPVAEPVRRGGSNIDFAPAIPANAGRVDFATRSPPSLTGLRFVARAITPPGHPRRYDTRFFLTFADDAGIDPSAIADSGELLDLQWVDMNAVSCLNMPEITKTVLAEVIDRMKVDPLLEFTGDVPFYLLRRGRFVRHML